MENEIEELKMHEWIGEKVMAGHVNRILDLLLTLHRSNVELGRRVEVLEKITGRYIVYDESGELSKTTRDIMKTMKKGPITL